MGEPITQLDSLELDASPRFLLGVRNKIERKQATGHVVSFSWNLPKVILLEILGWVRLIQELFGAPNGPAK
jgi:hypothetical protein